MEIRHIERNEFIVKVSGLCEIISLTYAISEASPEFIAYFANVLKKHYGYLTFEQLESAYEYNSLGYLNAYLPSNGFSKDNKIKGFNIPDMTKVIKAYAELKKIERPGIVKNDEVSDEQKNQIRQAWCNELLKVFDLYANEFERTNIGTPVYTCEVLAKCGLIEPARIDKKEKRINISMKGDKKRHLRNEELIYETFDMILAKGELLAPYLQDYINEFNKVEMPY